MKRDMDLVREIMLRFEGHDSPNLRRVNFTDLGVEEETLSEHLRLLIEADYIEGGISQALGVSVPLVQPRRITWRGHEFLDAARNDTIWTRTKVLVKEKGGSVPMEVFRALLVEASKRAVGL